MEATALILIAFLFLLGGAAAVWAKQGTNLTRVRASLAPGRTNHKFDDVAQDAKIAVPLPITTAAISHVEASVAPQTSPAAVDIARKEAATWNQLADLKTGTKSEVLETLIDRLDRIERSLAEMQRREVNRFAEREGELRQAIASLSAAIDADVARREAEIERLRAEFLVAFSSLKSTAPVGDVNRPRACAELYTRLAGLETALGAVTNPELLPGEPYVPPVEIAGEALLWENWNEVGEKSFAFAECYSSERLHLSPSARSEVGQFVTQLRSFLTGAVYPNLRTDPSAAQMAQLRQGLSDIAAAIPRVREALEREYWQG